MIVLLLATALAYPVDVADLEARLRREGLAWQVADPSVVQRFNPPPASPHDPLASLEPSAEPPSTAAAPAAAGASATDARFTWTDVGGQSFVSSIKDQGGCGSCFTFAALAAVEAMFAIALDEPRYTVDLSEQEVMSCIALGSCADGGTSQEVATYLESTGTLDEVCRPYLAYEEACDASRCADAETRRTPIDGWSTTLLPPSVSSLKSMLLHGPLAVNMHVYDDFYAYGSGVYKRSLAAQPSGWHVVLLVGWDDADNSWIAKNSWGEGFGDGGYFKISRAADCSWDFQSGVCFATNAVSFDVAARQAPAFPCTPEAPVLIEAVEYGGPVNVSFPVENCGGAGPLTFTPGAAPLGIALSYSGVVEPGESEQVGLIFDPEGFSVGTHQGNLAISTPTGAQVSVALEAVVQAYEMPVASFFASVTGGTAPLTVQFTNNSTGLALGTTWQFGDGATSTHPSPLHVYSAPGTYTVTLTLATPFDDVALVRQGYIIVSAPQDPGGDPGEEPGDSQDPGDADPGTGGSPDEPGESDGASRGSPAGCGAAGGLWLVGLLPLAKRRRRQGRFSRPA